MELPRDTPVLINMLSVINSCGPTFNTRSQTCQCLYLDTSTSQLDITPEVSEVTDPTPKSLTADRLEVLLQMQKTDPSAYEYPNAYQMESTSVQNGSFHTSEVFSTNTSLIQVRNSLF